MHRKVRAPTQMDQGHRHGHLHRCHGEKGPTVAMGWRSLTLNAQRSLPAPFITKHLFFSLQLVQG